MIKNLVFWRSIGKVIRCYMHFACLLNVLPTFILVQAALSYGIGVFFRLVIQ